MKTLSRSFPLIGFFLILSIGTSLSVKAQKNRPVVDDAITLITLLKKDYSQIADQELRANAIVKDRKQVINLIKVYVNQEEFSSEMQKHLIPDGSDKFHVFVNDPISLGGISVVSENGNLGTSTGSYQSFNSQLKDALAKLSTINVKLNSKKALEDYSVFDALKAGQSSELTKVVTLEYLLSKYTLRTLLNIFNDNSNNPYLADLTALFLKKYQSVYYSSFDAFATSVSATNVQKSLPFFGGGSLAFDDAIDGLARFLAKRFKEELTSQVFARIKKALSNPNSESDPFLELKILLPNTVKFIATLEHAELTGLIDVLKDHIETDLNNMVKQLPKLREAPKVKRLIEKNEDLRMAIHGLDLLVTLSKSNHPLDFFDEVAFSDLINEWSKPNVAIGRYNTAQGVKLTTLLVNSLTVNVADGRNWIQPEFWAKYAKELNFYKAFIGLMLQQDVLYYQIKIQDQLLAEILRAKHSSLSDVKGLIEKIQPRINRLLVRAEQLNNQIAAIKTLKRSNEKLSAESLHQYVSQVIALLEGGLETVDVFVVFFGGKEIELKNKMDSYLRFARTNNDILQYINQKKYAKAITTSLDLYYDLKRPEIDPVILDLVRVANDYHRQIEDNLGFQMLKHFKASLSTGTVINKDHLKTFLEFYKEEAGEAYYYSTIKALQSAVAHESNDYSRMGAVSTYLLALAESSISLTRDDIIAINQLEKQITQKKAISIRLIKRIQKILKVENQSLIALGAEFSKIRAIGTVADLSPGPNYNQVKSAYEELVKNHHLIVKKAGLELVWKGVDTLSNLIAIEISNLKEMKKKKAPDRWKKKAYEALEETVVKLKKANQELFKSFDSRTYRDSIKIAFTGMEEQALGVLYQLTTSGLSPEIRSKIERYVSFLSAIARAETAEDAEEAIESLVLPAGSSAIKRNSIRNVALNSYPGILGGLEFLGNDADLFGSFTAPIGLAISGQTKKNGSNTLYFTMMDIGAITRIRLSGDNTNELPSFTFKNLLAPGVYYIYGFKNSPLSFGLGGQYGPELVNDKGAQKSAFRFGLSFTVDIPLLNFYTRRN